VHPVDAFGPSAAVITLIALAGTGARALLLEHRRRRQLRRWLATINDAAWGMEARRRG
jgi:hypothetical protein